MNSETYSLAQLGWRPFYSQQLTLEDLDHAFPARIATVQRGLLVVLAASGAHRVTLPQRLRPEGAMPSLTVGDWVLVLNETSQVVRLLERQSLIMRMAAGTAQAPQSIAVAKDTTVLTLNATDRALSLASLAPWLEAGQTVAFVGSSGVGKSTLINSLLGVNSQETRAIRDADSKGRHTTTARYFLQAPCGAWLIDTPGMRELKIGAAAMATLETASAKSSGRQAGPSSAAAAQTGQRPRVSHLGCPVNTLRRYTP